MDLKSINLLFWLSLIGLLSCRSDHADSLEDQHEGHALNQTYDDLDQLSDEEIHDVFTLDNFLDRSLELDRAVNTIFDQFTEDQRVAQLIISSVGKKGKKLSEVEQLVQDQVIGGVAFLTELEEGYEQTSQRLSLLAKQTKLPPLLYSADAEPSLINSRIKGLQKFPKTNKIKTQFQSRSVAREISEILIEAGVHQNYAPVMDLEANRSAIGNRSFGPSLAENIELALPFIDELQSNGIIATAKHFPGHGAVKGDSHKKLVYIDGDLTELDAFSAAIDAGVLSVMVGHIAVQNHPKYNTDGLPSTLSRTIITDLLKQELGFQGIIITDAMDMGAVKNIPQAGLKALQAGCDVILMPEDERKLHQQIIKARGEDLDFRQQTDASIRWMIRLKLCMGLFSEKVS